jgi:hypothetical protein
MLRPKSMKSEPWTTRRGTDRLTRSDQCLPAPPRRHRPHPRPVPDPHIRTNARTRVLLLVPDPHIRTNARTRVLLLVRDLHIRIINAATGELLRQPTLDRARNAGAREVGGDYQPAARPDPRPNPTTTQTPRTLTWVRGVLDVLRHHIVEVAGIEPASFSTSPGLLRVQPAVLFSAPAVTQASCRRAQSLLAVPSDPATGSGGRSSLLMPDTGPEELPG